MFFSWVFCRSFGREMWRENWQKPGKNLWFKQVSIPSQRRYVEYWASLLSFPSGVRDRLPEVGLPQPQSRELRQIRLYDTINTDSVYFVVSELQEVTRLSQSHEMSCLLNSTASTKGLSKMISALYWLIGLGIDFAWLFAGSKPAVSTSNRGLKGLLQANKEGIPEEQQPKVLPLFRWCKWSEVAHQWAAPYRPNGHWEPHSLPEDLPGLSLRQASAGK